jgi:DNA-binding response OmpR family regulator
LPITLSSETNSYSNYMSQLHLPSLVVVEDPLISNFVRALLHREDYGVTVAGVTEATALLRRPKPFDGILVTNTPSLFLDFADSVRLLYLSSAPDPQLQARFRRCRAVRKPFIPAALVQAVRELDVL